MDCDNPLLKEQQVTQILIVTSQEKNFSGFMDGLKQNKTVTIITAGSAKEALDSLSPALPDLIIIDEEVEKTPGLVIARAILMKNAMVNQAVVSRLSSEEFHEASEGLGIMAQLPPEPDAVQAKIVLEILEKMP